MIFGSVRVCSDKTHPGQLTNNRTNNHTHHKYRNKHQWLWGKKFKKTEADNLCVREMNAWLSIRFCRSLAPNATVTTVCLSYIWTYDSVCASPEWHVQRVHNWNRNNTQGSILGTILQRYQHQRDHTLSPAVFSMFVWNTHNIRISTSPRQSSWQLRNFQCLRAQTNKQIWILIRIENGQPMNLAATDYWLWLPSQ